MFHFINIICITSLTEENHLETTFNWMRIDTCSVMFEHPMRRFDWSGETAFDN